MRNKSKVQLATFSFLLGTYLSFEQLDYTRYRAFIDHLKFVIKSEKATILGYASVKTNIKISSKLRNFIQVGKVGNKSS